jgi:hypothetical protein
LIATSAATPLSFAVGVAVTTGTKIMWDRLTAAGTREGIARPAR